MSEYCEEITNNKNSVPPLTVNSECINYLITVKEITLNEQVFQQNLHPVMQSPGWEQSLLTVPLSRENSSPGDKLGRIFVVLKL